MQLLYLYENGGVEEYTSPMIIVVEGVSAAGKSSWASRYAPAVLNEISGSPSEEMDIAAVGQFWSDKQSERWQRGLKLEQLHGIACFDTDVLKIHYSWCLWQIGQSRREVWLANVLSSRERIAQKQLGFADLIVLLEPPEDVVRQQKANDRMRRRSNFEAHVRLSEPLRRWYMLLDALSPGRVAFNAHQTPELRPIQLREDRYSLQLFDALIDAADLQPDTNSFALKPPDGVA
jgi:hypothetical protein